MFISYIYISFINIKTCNKYDASSVNEQIKTYILTMGGGGGGGGEENTKTTYIHDHFGERKNKNFIFTTIVFLGGGGGKRRNKVLTFFLKKTVVKMTVCLARFRSKGSLIICEIRNIDHVRVYHGISFIQSKTTISIMETCIYSYVYLSVSNIYLSVYLYVCMYVFMYMHICMYVCMYVCICLSVHVYLSIVLFSLPPKMDVNIKVFFKFSLHPKSQEIFFLYFLAQKTVVKISISLFSLPKQQS